jgi:hypothetical protein
MVRHRGGRGIAARAALPDRRQPCAPGREREIVACDANSLAALIAEAQAAGNKGEAWVVATRSWRPAGAPRAHQAQVLGARQGSKLEADARSQAKLTAAPPPRRYGGGPS